MAHMPRCSLSKLLVVAAALSLCACDGLSPGDYLVYRVAFQQPQMSADCFAAGAVPVNEQDDSSSVFTAGTFILYMGADEVPYLDLGTITLAGEGSSDEFTFKGSSVDVNFSGDMNQTRQETRISTTIDLTIDGETISGTVKQSTRTDCSGPECPDPPSTNCTTTTPFVGGEVEDVDLKHEV